jgi:hypothetical protein
LGIHTDFRKFHERVISIGPEIYGSVVVCDDREFVEILSTMAQGCSIAAKKPYFKSG